jgi:hypothetical protein
LTASDFIARLVAMLEAAGIPHMLAGSFATAYHGIPRTTLDVDVVIDPSPQALESLVSSASAAGYYVDADRAREALQRRRQFNVIDPASGWKADLIIRKERPFSREEFQRRGRAVILGTTVFVASAEDTVLSKLEWAARSDSDRQLSDARGIVSARGTTLDRDYLERWAGELGVLDLWHRISG